MNSISLMLTVATLAGLCPQQAWCEAGAGGAFAQNGRDFWGSLVSFWNYEVFAVGADPITLGKIISAVLLMLAGGFLSRRLSRGIGSLLTRRFDIAVGAAAAIQSLLFYFLAIVFTLFALHLVHVPLTVFTLLGGAVAIGVGFGSQNLISNFISGLILLLERPIRVGDLVEVEGQLGRVKQIGARCTRVQLGSNVDVMVPNSALLEKAVVNWTLHDQRIRSSIKVGVSYDSDPELVKKLLLKVADEHELVLKDPPPLVVFADFGESAFIFQLFYWFRLTEFIGQLTMESELRFAIYRHFKEAGIIIPFPQRDVHLRDNPGARRSVGA